MKKNHYCLALLLFPLLLSAQLPDSLRRKIDQAAGGEERYKAVRLAYNYYEELNRDSALAYADSSVEVARRNRQKLAEGYSLVNKAYQLIGLGKLGAALQCLLQVLPIADDEKNDTFGGWTIASLSFQGNNRLLDLAYFHHMYGILMVNTENVEQQIIHFREAMRLGKRIGYEPRVTLGAMNLGRAFYSSNRLDSALYYEELSKKVALESSFLKYLGIVELNLGDIYQALGQPQQAMEHYYAGIKVSIEQRNNSALGRNYLRVIRYHLAAGNKDSALYYAKRNLATGIEMGKVVGLEMNLGTAYQNLYLAYELNKQPDSAYHYLALALRIKDSMYALRIRNLSEFQDLSFGEQMRLRELDKEKELYRNRVRTYVLIGGIVVLLVIAGLSYRNNRQKTKAKKQIEDAYDHLKSTQAQLVQAEKMASLGELTAGIAHEIQNPLNFVNNFSEINKDLITELQQELKAGNTNDAVAISNDIRENEEKISHHGRRADSIVKGMLQHSRSGSGQKELTDINAIADEYLRLAYHGLRAKDKTFNAKLEIEADPAVGRINVVAQDIGRVILNLINNAFYAVSEKQKTQPAGYEPTVKVTTKQLADKVEIVVSDNGNGIPDSAMNKIFNPFFTTKPAGEGTGLGLSLSYDIVTKGHGGKLTVNTKPGEGTSFTIQLPSHRG